MEILEYTFFSFGLTLRDTVKILTCRTVVIDPKLN